MIHSKKKEILSKKEMEKALKSGSEIIVNINQRPVRKLKENSFITIFLEFSKVF